MKLYIISIIFLMTLLNTNRLIGQSATPWPTKHKNVYAEFLGNGLFISTNFDMRFRRGVQDGLGFRAGIGGITVEGTNRDGDQVEAGLVTFPLGINYLVGKGRSSFETGLGLTLMYASAEVKGRDIEVDADGVGAVGVVNFGYRYQPKKSGFMFRINWSPLFGPGGFAPAWFGVGMGFGFK